MTLAVGTELGSFEIVRPLDAGGMGEVYLARDRHLNRHVAIKVLPTEVTGDRRRLARFELEARAASALTHPNICHIYSLGEIADGQQFIAMEYVDGETLRHRLLRQRLDVREALEIAIQIAAGLAAAHASGIVHRDIKPENVMIRRDRLVKILDFGLAKVVTPEALAAHTSTHTMFATSPGSLVGTTGYMSPEQARGQHVDARTDVWSLGIVLYEMLTGVAPFTGTTPSDVLVAILDREPRSLTDANLDVPGELKRIVAKALKKDSERRYQTMKDLLLDLEALRDELALSERGRPTESILEPILARRRHGLDRRTMIGGAAVLIVALAASAWWMLRSDDSPAARGPAASAGPENHPYIRLTFGPGLQADPTFSPDGKFIAYTADTAGNLDIWVKAVSGDSEPIQVTKSPAQETQPAWSPDGTTLVFRSDRGDGGLFIVPAFGGPERQLTSFGSNPTWSADGSAVLFFTGFLARYRAPGTAQMKLWTVALDGEPPRQVLQDFLRDGYWIWAAPHPDGRISVLGSHRTRGRGFFTVSREGRQVTASKMQPFGMDVTPGRPRGATPHRFQWNAEGTLLYFEAATRETRNLWRVKVDRSSLDWLSLERLTTPAGRDVAPSLSRDGRRIVFSQQKEASRIWAFPLDSGAGRLRITGHGRPLTEEGAVASLPSLSADGSKLAHELWRPGTDRSELWVMDVDGGKRELLATSARSPVWSRNGRNVAYVYLRGSELPPETAIAYRSLDGGTERFLTRWNNKFVFVPTDWTVQGDGVVGLWVAAVPGTPPTSVAVWPTSSRRAGQPERILLSSPAGAQIWCAMLSPDGRWIHFTMVQLDPDSGEPLLRLMVARPGAREREWVRIAPDHEWPDKPRWSADGKTIFFISKGSTSHLNLWAAGFDPDRGRPVGEPFALTHFDSPTMAISPYIDESYLAISARHAVLQMQTLSGSIWMIENVDR